MARASAALRRLRRWIRFAPGAIETALRVVEGETVRLRAMALTYISLFALVPALVVAFSVVEAFTGMERISRLVHEFLLDNLAVGARTSIEPYLDRFIENAHAGSAGVVGGALLLWSSISLFSNVDHAVNDVWGIRRRRPIGQQAVIYWMGVTLGPILLAGSLTLGVAARGWLAGTGLGFLGVAASALLTCLFFGTLYLTVPATKVKLRAAAAGGLVAGIAWELAKWAYTYAVARIFRYHAVYGSVATVPIFILWLFVSWSIMLFGARLAFVFQYASALRPRAGASAGREVLGGEAMLAVALAFDDGGEPPDAGDVAARCRGTPDEVGEVLGALRSAGLLVAASDGGLLPSRPLERLTLLDVRRAVVGPLADGPAPSALVGKIVKEIEDQASERLAATSFRDLVARARREGDPAAVRMLEDDDSGPSAGPTVA